MSMNVCRFCGAAEYDRTADVRLVKYGVRHYAHHRCYLQAGKKITDLHDWQIVAFPARLIKEYSLEQEAETAYVREGNRIQAISAEFHR